MTNNKQEFWFYFSTSDMMNYSHKKSVNKTANNVILFWKPTLSYNKLKLYFVLF